MMRFASTLPVLLMACVLLGCEGAEDAMLRRAISSLAAPREDLYGGDAMRVLVCGSASPLPHATRARPCTAVFAAGKLWVVDVGPGSWNNVGRWRVSPDRIGAVLLTHFHSDHIGELGEWNLQSWVAGRAEPLRVVGPAGVERVVAGFSEAYALDRGYRTAHHGADFMVPAIGEMRAAPFQLPSNALHTIVHDDDGLRITAFSVDHAPISPAVGYRFDWRGRSVVVSGDTVKSANLIDVAKDADVLVHEAQANHLVAMLADGAKTTRPRVSKVMGDIPSYHTTPVQAAEAANAANVKLLVLSHLTPPPPNELAKRVFLRGVDGVRASGWVMADDGMLITLPADSDAIEQGEIE